ncbi:MAG: aminoacylase [Anaerolinea sp.]|nr:aminoacylase [Anaerolinea sp.]
MTFDLLITGAHVYPGDSPATDADVAVTDGLIAAVGRSDRWAAHEVIDGRGLILCPGFIDLHAHSGLRPFVDPLLSPKAGQGFTTELIGPDGLAPAPVTRQAWPTRMAYLAPIEGPGPERALWATMDEYLAALQEARPATNLVASVGHNAVREHVMGRDDRPPTHRELAAMCDEIRSALEAGARALSFGLIYVPGVFADTNELVELAREAARFDAPLMPHIRNEGAGVIGAVAEMIEVARRSGARLHITHLKLVGSPALLDPLLGLIGEATREIEITFDQYPYGAGSTTLGAILPPWALAGGREATLVRLLDRDTRARIIREMATGLPGWENLYGTCGPERVVIVDVPASHVELIGGSLAEIGERRGRDPAEAAIDVLVETEMSATMIDHYASDEVVRAIFAHPLALVGSDGIFGPHPHPRVYATAARVLGRFAIRERLITVEEAVARLSSRPADLLGLADRGRIREGLRADLVLLDPTAYVDTATYEQPCQQPPGVIGVFVGGRMIQREGAATGERPGTVLRGRHQSPAA